MVRGGGQGWERFGGDSHGVWAAGDESGGRGGYEGGSRIGLCPAAGGWRKWGVPKGSVPRGGGHWRYWGARRVWGPELSLEGVGDMGREGWGTQSRSSPALGVPELLGIPDPVLCAGSSPRVAAGEERAADRERDPRAVPQIPGDLPEPAHPAGAGGTPQDLR